MALCISRKVGERVCLVTKDEVVWVEVQKSHASGRTKLRIDAPPSVNVLREEIISREILEARNEGP